MERPKLSWQLYRFSREVGEHINDLLPITYLVTFRLLRSLHDMTLDGEPRFPILFRLMADLLCIPSSNADVERGFSILQKVHTDERASLSHSTIVVLMSLKFKCCLFFRYSFFR